MSSVFSLSAHENCQCTFRAFQGEPFLPAAIEDPNLAKLVFWMYPYACFCLAQPKAETVARPAPKLATRFWMALCLEGIHRLLANGLVSSSACPFLGLVLKAKPTGNHSL